MGKIIVDADACPVKREIIETARRFNVPVVMVASYAHRISQEDGVDIVQTDMSDQSVDLAIANRLHAGDIVITQDFGLAALALGKGADAISNRGQLYSDQDIDYLLQRRHEHGRIRRGGGRHKGPKPFSEEDRKSFLHILTKLLVKKQESRPM